LLDRTMTFRYCKFQVEPVGNPENGNLANWPDIRRTFAPYSHEDNGCERSWQ
jgi:hypothetical protein